MTSRTIHQLSLIRDRDLLHTGLVALAACVLSAGLVYVGYFVHVVRTARRAPCAPVCGERLLLFGKHAPQGRVDVDFAARLDRAASLWRDHPPRHLILLGGGALGELSEAEIARDALFARGMAHDVPLQLESGSRDTLQNLRNARHVLGGAVRERVTLLSTATTWRGVHCSHASLVLMPNSARLRLRCHSARETSHGLRPKPPTSAGSTWAPAGCGSSATSGCWRG